MPGRPSGEQHEISHGGGRAVVAEVGAALRAYAVDGHPIVDGFGADEMCSGARGQPLIPWPNRLRDGSYEHDGETHQLPLSEPERHNAIHGLVRWANWTVERRGPGDLVMHHALHPQPGYPFSLDLRLEYRLDDSGLSVRMTATNAGATSCPFGAGAHPYITAGTATIDDNLLTAPGTRRVTTDDRELPTGDSPVPGTSYDFTAPRRIGETVLDTAYSHLERDGDGRAWVELEAPERHRRVSLWLDEGYEQVMLFTGDTLPQRDRRRRSLGVEPMTCAPDAFNSGIGLIVLEPGRSCSAAWGIVAHINR